MSLSANVLDSVGLSRVAGSGEIKAGLHMLPMINVPADVR